MPGLSAKMSDGRMVYGAAAQQHIIKEDGGWDEHHRKFAKLVVDVAMREYDKKLSKKKFDLVKGKKKVG